VTQVLLVRHAHALPRSAWTDPDSERPLDERGQRQAAGLVAGLAGHTPGRLVTSPFLRCVQTVEPLAAALGLQPELDERLVEDGDADQARALLHELAGSGGLACTHGDLLGRLLGRHTAKGGAWLLDPATLEPVEYLPPPPGR
jgi:phosphohistidine phosphatase SixA